MEHSFVPLSRMGIEGQWTANKALSVNKFSEFLNKNSEKEREI